MFSSTRQGEMSRTAEMLIEIVEKNKGNAARTAADVLHMIRSTNRTTEKDLSDLQAVLDSMMKKKDDIKIDAIEATIN